MARATLLTNEELRHYHRQLALDQVGLEGQRQLKRASVLIVGAGGLGSPVALYLAAAGVGHLGLMDPDVVEATNLHRQVLHSTRDLGKRKVASAREKLLALNPHIRLTSIAERLTSNNALEFVDDYDVVVDGTDNFPSRYLINDACVLTQTPNVYGSVYRFEGQLSVFAAAGGPCFRCLYPSPPPALLVPSCAEDGVLGVLPGVVGCLQAAEALKLILNTGTPMIGLMLLIDVLGSSFQSLTVQRNPACVACGDEATLTQLTDYESFCGLSTDAEVVPEISARDLYALRRDGAATLILDVRQRFESHIASLGADLLIPLPELNVRLPELNRHRTGLIVAHCRTGARSRKAVQLLQRAGYTNVKSLAGGILAWKNDVDPSITAY